MNQREFAERVTAMQGSLYRVAASYLRGESDRLDAVAETIAKAWERRADPPGQKPVCNVDDADFDPGSAWIFSADKSG